MNVRVEWVGSVGTWQLRVGHVLQSAGWREGRTDGYITDVVTTRRRSRHLRDRHPIPL